VSSNPRIPWTGAIQVPLRGPANKPAGREKKREGYFSAFVHTTTALSVSRCI